MKMKKVIYRQSTSGNEKVFPSSMKSLGKVYGKSLGKVYWKSLGKVYGKSLGKVYGKSLGKVYGKSLSKVYGKSLGKVYGKKACSMIRSDGNTSFLVQYTSITMQIKTFTNFCKPNVINLRLI